MATASNQFQPDYAVPPGWVLEERLTVRGISQAEFARRCGRSTKLISEIISGKASLEPETALQFEKVLGLDASIWLGIESAYRLHRAREAEAAAAAASAEWSKAFPVRELARRGYFRRPQSDAESVSNLLAFFGVGSEKAWGTKYGLANVAYRHSPSFESDEAALATWLRLGELAAERQDCSDYDEAGFKRAVREIRGFTCLPFGEGLERARQLSNRSGVALAWIEPLPKTALSGAAWWRAPGKAVIQLSARHKTDDHLWFSFFHEAAHIFLHSKKGVFVDGTGDDLVGLETEANEWASNMLVAHRDWARFVVTSPQSEQAVRSFAKAQGIAPGIVVGLLQHARQLPWSHLNGLKKKLRWEELK